MRIKYLGTKLLLVLGTFLATPVVWAALAWPQWSSASPSVDDFAEVETSAASASEPVVQVQQVIHRIIVVPRYVEIAAAPSTDQPHPAPAAPPASTPAPLPPPAQAAIVEAIVPANQQRQDTPARQQQQTVSSGASGSDGGGSSGSSVANSSSNSRSNSQSTTRGS
jgi:hypothetical protein